MAGPLLHQLQAWMLLPDVLPACILRSRHIVAAPRISQPACLLTVGPPLPLPAACPALCLQVLGTYKPLVWAYSRLNITHNVMSKRKLNRLVTDSHVLGWDDPRLLTLAGLRRRGVTPQVGGWVGGLGWELVDAAGRLATTSALTWTRAAGARWACCARCASSSPTCRRGTLRRWRQRWGRRAFAAAAAQSL